MTATEKDIHANHIQFFFYFLSQKSCLSHNLFYEWLRSFHATNVKDDLKENTNKHVKHNTVENFLNKISPSSWIDAAFPGQKTAHMNTGAKSVSNGSI